VRLRLGISLWLLSWIPYGLILGLSGVWLTLSWGFEILLGLTGLALAGKEFADAVKRHGWKGAPAVAWRAFRDGASVRRTGVGPVDQAG
jgi:hypothetical protein